MVQGAVFAINKNEWAKADARKLLLGGGRVWSSELKPIPPNLNQTITTGPFKNFKLRINDGNFPQSRPIHVGPTTSSFSR